MLLITTHFQKHPVSLTDPSQLLRPEPSFHDKLDAFRDYSVDAADPVKERVRRTYLDMHTNVTVDLVKRTYESRASSRSIDPSQLLCLQRRLSLAKWKKNRLLGLSPKRWSHQIRTALDTKFHGALLRYTSQPTEHHGATSSGRKSSVDRITNQSMGNTTQRECLKAIEKAV